MDYKLLILDTIEDLIKDFFYYERKEDEELSIEQLDDAINNKIITKDEIKEKFIQCIDDFFKNNYE